MVLAPQFGSSFGVMQGRLSKQTPRGYQAFPWEEWVHEFERAASRGLQHIEWVLDSHLWEENPLVCRVDDVSAVVRDSGVAVRSVCADYLMDTPLTPDDRESWARLDRVLQSMKRIRASYLVIPFVDHSSFLGSSAGASFRASVEELERRATHAGVMVALETDLGPRDFASLLGALDPSVFGVNYDIGNSSSLGHDPTAELDAYGDRVCVLHVKDRPLAGRSVPLGAGDADISLVLRELAARGFNGITTMQAYRDEEGLSVFDAQLEAVSRLISGIPGGRH